MEKSYFTPKTIIISFKLTGKRRKSAIDSLTQNTLLSCIYMSIISTRPTRPICMGFSTILLRGLRSTLNALSPFRKI